MTSLFSSLRARFLLAILLWVTLGIVGIWYSSVRLFTMHVELQYHEELEVHVKELGSLTTLDGAGNPRLLRPLSDPRYAQPLSGFYWQVTRPGFVALRSPSMARGTLDDKFAHSPQILHRISNGPTGPVIVYGYTREAAGGEPIHFVIATDQRHLDRIIHAFTRELTAWLTALALALLASGLAIITLGLRPFDRLAAAIERLRRGGSNRIEGRYPDEIQPLVTDLNAYVERTEEIVARGRVQAGALAHSLRTPLAVITDEAERLQEGPRPEAAATLLAQSERMLSQIDYHLARVRSGGSTMGVASRSRLADVLTPLIRAMQRCHPGKQFVADVPADLLVAMDSDDLSEMLNNLLDNAGKWAASTIWVQVDAGQIRICDDGPGIADALREQVFEIGETGADPLGNSGLGLPIARAIARDYGGEIELADRPGGGLCARLILPK